MKDYNDAEAAAYYDDPANRLAGDGEPVIHWQTGARRLGTWNLGSYIHRIVWES